MAAVQDATVVTEVNDALSHLQTAYDRFNAIGVKPDHRLDEAIFHLRNIIGVGGKSHSSSQTVANDAHSV